MAALSRAFTRSSRTPEALIDALGLRLGRRPRVLDFGVGFGRLAVRRVASGYDIYGVDIDSADLAAGRAALREAGHDPERFQLIVDGHSPFADQHFDFVYSEDTLEHVGDLAPVVAEIRRLTAPGGLGLHSFPGNRRVVESHLDMPFLQWVPRGSRLQDLLISAWTLVGMESPDRFPDLAGRSPRLRATYYYRWYQRNTVYRPRRVIDAAFRSAGFSTQWTRHPTLAALTHEYLITALS